MITYHQLNIFDPRLTEIVDILESLESIDDSSIYLVFGSKSIPIIVNNPSIDGINNCDITLLKNHSLSKKTIEITGLPYPIRVRIKIWKILHQN